MPVSVDHNARAIIANGDAGVKNRPDHSPVELISKVNKLTRVKECIICGDKFNAMSIVRVLKIVLRKDLRLLINRPTSSNEIPTVGVYAFATGRIF